MQMRKKVGKSRNTVFFQWFVAPEGRKVGSLKRRVRSQLARWEMKLKTARRCGAKHMSKWKYTKHTIVGPLLEVAMSKKCTPLWREAHFEVKMYKTHHCRTTFGSCDVEKVHAVVARSTFRSQNVQNTPLSDHFWKFRCRKSARRCGAKHISEVKMYKTHHCRTTFGSSDVEKVHAVVARSTFEIKMLKALGVRSLLEVQISKKCTPLWREAHFEVKMFKTLGVRTTFGGSDVASRGRRKGLCTLSKVSKTWGFWSIFNYNDHYTTLHSNTLHYNYNYTSLHSTTLQSTTLHCTQLHSITLHYITPHSSTLHYTTLHYLPLHFTTLHYTTLHNTTTTTTQLHSTTLHYTKLHYTRLHYTTLHSTTLHYTRLHYTTLHDLPLHFTTLHYTPLHYNYSCNYNYTPLHSTTLNYTTLLHYTTLHYIPLHSTTLHYITLNDTAPQIDR